MRTVGDPALRRLIPIYCGLGVLVAVLFGPTGMSADALIGGMHDSPRFRLGLWLAWLAVVVSPTRLLFHNRDAFYLRSWPVAPGVHYALLAGLALLIQLPWTWLWLRGAGALAALAATLTAAALCCILAISARSLFERLLIPASACVLLGLLGLAVPSWQLACVSALALAIAVAAAWRRAPERRRTLDVASLTAGPMGLLIVYLVAIARQRSSSVARGLVLAAIGGALTGLIARNNDLVDGEGVAVLALVFATILSGAATAMIVGPVVEAERDMRWLLAATGTSPARRMLASALACAGAGLAYAAVFAGLLLWIAPVSAATAARLVVVLLPMGAFIGLLGLRCVRFAERVDGIDGARLVAATVGVVLVTVALLGAIGEWAVPVVGAAAVKVTLASTEQTLRLPGRRWRR